MRKSPTLISQTQTWTSTWRVALWLLCVAVPAEVLCASPKLQPEGSSGWTPKTEVYQLHDAVAAANPLAAKAGQTMLAQGGSAIDAAIATQMVLNLVEPQSSGIGGGAFLLYYDGQNLQAYDGRETAPMAAGEDLFLDAKGQPMSHRAGVVGGRAVGVPGVLRMLYLAHQQHGRLPWAHLFAPAIVLAREGFVISPRLAGLLKNETALKKDVDAAAYFYDDQGRPWPAGHRLRNPELAEILQAIATQGPDALMRGEVAQAMVRKVHDYPGNPGTLALEDLAGYRPAVREALCFHFVGADDAPYRVCGMPPPNSGQIALAQILGLLAQTPAPRLTLRDGQITAQWLHLYLEASRLAYADRAQFVADPDFVTPPGGAWDSLWDSSYLLHRAQLIDASPNASSMGPARAGQPGTQKIAWAPMPGQPEHGTSHLSVMDRFGGVLAMTTSIEDGFGARILVNRGLGLSGGFLLNNQLTDFSFEPRSADGLPVANRVQPGKRPRSTMSPTLVFDAKGQPLMALGSPGGPLIAHFVAKVLWGRLRWQLPLQAAIDLPNFANLNGPSLLEAGRFDPATVGELNRRGQQVQQFELPSGIQVLERSGPGIRGAADPRREGAVLGD